MDVKKFRLLPMLLSLALLFSLLSGFSLPLLADEEAGLKVIHILHTNDVHGRFYQVNANNIGMMGIDKIAAIKNHYENSILVDVGDAIHGMPLVNMSYGLTAIEFMVTAGYQVMAPGNHDFNYGSDRLLELAEIAAEGGLSIISTNVIVTESNEFFLPQIAVVEVAGVKVGFFGLSPLSTPVQTLPSNVETLTFAEYTLYADMAISALKADEEVDLVIGLAHAEKLDVEAMILGLTIKPDIIILGHDHWQGYDAVEGVRLYGAKDLQEMLGLITITLDEENSIVEVDFVLIEKEEAVEFESDPEVFDLAEARKAEHDEEFSRVVAVSTLFLSAERGTNDFESFGLRNSEQPLGNLVADAMRIISGADIAFMNGGGLREPILEGEINMGAINAILPYSNYLVIKEITPVVLKEALEVGFGRLPAADGRMPQFSGMVVEFNPGFEVGERVISISIGGTKLDLTDDTTVYTLATHNFMATGGDGYVMLKDLETVIELGSLDDILVEYITSLPDATITEEFASIDGRMIMRATLPHPGHLVTMTIGSDVVSQGRMLLPPPSIAPQLINDRTMLPFRYIIEVLLGYEVEYDAETHTVTTIIKDVEYFIDLCELTIYVDGKLFDGQQPVLLQTEDGDFTLAPIRAFQGVLDELNYTDGVVTFYP